MRSDDVVQVQRFQIGLDAITAGSDEFLRADSAPLATHGDGAIRSDDVVQTQRFQIGLDPLQTMSAAEISLDEVVIVKAFVGGRLRLDHTAGSESRLSRTGVEERSLRVAARERKLGLDADVIVDATGDESAYGFTLRYDPSVLGDPVLSVGKKGGRPICNVSTPGKIICSITSFGDDEPGSGSDQIGEIQAGRDEVLLKVSFTTVDRTMGDPPAIDLVHADVSNDRGDSLRILF